MVMFTADYQPNTTLSERTIPKNPGRANVAITRNRHEPKHIMIDLDMSPS